jgi:uncharacterized protein
MMHSQNQGIRIAFSEGRKATMSTYAAPVLLAALLVAVFVTGRAEAQASDPVRPAVKPAIKFGVQPFDLKRVRLLDGPFRDAMERDRTYLHDLDADRLLHTWRVNAGLPSTAEPLGGWESPECEVRGHTLGHYLTACALMYSSCSDEVLKKKAEYIVAELATCQEALGAKGYLSAFPESFIERAEKCEQTWAPLYTQHKLFAGLQDVYVHCGSAQALVVVERMAAWLKGRVDKLSKKQMDAMLDATEQGGMNETLANLYGLTENPDQLAMARRFDQKRYVEPLAEGKDRLKGEHANSFIPNMIGTARQYELTGDKRDRDIATHFWKQVTGERMYCTGGTSNCEHWQTPPGVLANELSDFTQETCCTYNMLKLTRHLFCWVPTGVYADYYERALWNSILSTQNPDTGMCMYFLPMAPGRWKMYGTPNDAFWCCTASGLENHAKYGDSIYFHNGDDVFVTQFIASEVDWREKGVVIRQETKFPEEPRTKLTVKVAKPTRFSMRIRVPYWTTNGFVIRVNGKPVDGTATPSSFFAIDRTWKDGDTVEVEFAMRLHAHPMPDDATVAAFMYGPFVLAGKLGGEGLTQENTHTGVNWYRFENAPPVAPLVGDAARPERWIKPVPGQPLTFATTGQERNITLVPYHRLFGERYAIYWNVFAKNSPKYEAMLKQVALKKKRAARVVDSVVIYASESEKAHNLKGEHTGGGFALQRYWRHANQGGWFSYTLKVDPDGPTNLLCTYWGDDDGPRNFDILVDEQVIATQTLNKNSPGQFFDVEYPIPAALTQEKTAVTVRFQAKPRAMAGGIFQLMTLRNAPTQ